MDFSNAMVDSGMPVAEFKMSFGIIMRELYVVCVPGSLVAKFARKAAGSQVGFRLPCRMPAITATL